MTRLDGRTYILDDDAQHSVFCMANRYPYRHGFGAHSFALHLRLLYRWLNVDPLTALRVARWRSPNGCNPAHDRVVRRLDKREQQSLWVVRRLRPDADPAAFLAHHDEVRSAKRARIAQLTGRDEGFRVGGCRRTGVYDRRSASVVGCISHVMDRRLRWPRRR